jgi:hypothetical protein
MVTRLKSLPRALAAGAIVLGAGLGASGIAAAATGSSSSSNASSSSSTAPSTGAAGSGDPATLTHGPGETLLTGTDLQKATTAAEAAVPGATVVRAETNSSGASPYEVHLKKSDGSYVTVELDSNFNVMTTVSGFGAGPVGSTPPASPGTSSSGTSSTSA